MSGSKSGMEIPAFSNEAEEAKWWDEHQDLLTDQFETAAKDGTLSRGTLAKKDVTHPADSEFIVLESKVKVRGYRTRVSYEFTANDVELTERESSLMQAAFRIAIEKALCDIINPEMIRKIGDEQLKANYTDIFELALKLDLLKETFDDLEAR